MHLISKNLVKIFLFAALALALVALSMYWPALKQGFVDGFHNKPKR